MDGKNHLGSPQSSESQSLQGSQPRGGSARPDCEAALIVPATVSYCRRRREVEANAGANEPLQGEKFHGTQKEKAAGAETRKQAAGKQKTAGKARTGQGTAVSHLGAVSSEGFRVTEERVRPQLSAQPGFLATHVAGNQIRLGGPLWLCTPATQRALPALLRRAAFIEFPPGDGAGASGVAGSGQERAHRGTRALRRTQTTS
ncbi:hypothetical protein MRX96_057757 [Rhipicephalus microplus]